MRDQEFSGQLDSILTSYVQFQIRCMLMQHEGCNKIRANDSETGLIILEAVSKMRDKLSEQKAMLLETVSKGEFDESCERTGFDKILFSAVSDTVLNDNTIYFEFGPRPAGDAYKCDEIACKAKIFTLVKEYFPSLYSKPAA